MAPKKKAPKTVEIESSLDPIFPLPAGTGIFPVKNGDGKDILSDTHIVMLELPFNAFYNLWGYVERIAAQEYPKRKNDPNDALRAYAEGQLAAVHAFRSAFRGEILPMLTEAEAEKIRKKEAKVKKRPVPDGEAADRCPNCGEGSLEWRKKKSKTGEKLWKCNRCGHKWPRIRHGETPRSVSKARGGKKQGSAGRNAETATQRPKKRPKKKS